MGGGAGATVVVTEEQLMAAVAAGGQEGGSPLTIGDLLKQQQEVIILLYFAVVTRVAWIIEILNVAKYLKACMEPNIFITSCRPLESSIVRSSALVRPLFS